MFYSHPSVVLPNEPLLFPFLLYFTVTTSCDGGKDKGTIGTDTTKGKGGGGGGAGVHIKLCHVQYAPMFARPLSLAKARAQLATPIPPPDTAPCVVKGGV